MTAGWVVKRLGEISAINYGYTESAVREPIGPRFLRITDIQDDHVDWDSVPYCPIAAESVEKYRLATGDIVFARTGATTGKSFLIQDPPEAVFASYLIRLRLLDGSVLPEFVSLFFQTAEYWQEIKKGASGSAQGGFNATKLGDLSIPIPPVPDQQRIVAILDESFDGIVAAKANAKKALKDIQELRDASLRAVVSEYAANGVEISLGKLFEIGSSKRVLKSEWKSEGVPFYRGREITRLSIDGYVDNELFISEDHFQELSRRSGVPREGDILITAIGTIGNAYIVRSGDRFYFKDASVLWMRRLPGVSSEFVWYWLKSPFFYEQLDRGNGATVDTLTIQKLGSVLIRVPPLAEQQMAAARLDALFAEVIGAFRIYEQKLAALDNLKKSLLHHAFSGQF